MANPAPCQACLEQPDAEFYVTNRLGVPWPFEQSTVALCVPCFINVGITMGEALQAALTELAAQASPDELAQIEANDPGTVAELARPKSRQRKRATTATATVEPEAAEEAEAADD